MLGGVNEGEREKTGGENKRRKETMEAIEECMQKTRENMFRSVLST